MELVLNLNTVTFVQKVDVSLEVTGFSCKVRDTLQLDVKFSNGLALVAPGEEVSLVFGIKETLADTEFLAYIATWTEVEAGHYRGQLSLNTANLVGAIGSAESLAALGELTWSTDGGEQWQSSPTLNVTIRGDVVTGLESAPLNMPTANGVPSPIDISGEPLNETLAMASINSTLVDAVDGETLTLNGVVFTFRDYPASEPLDVLIAIGDPGATRANLAAKLVTYEANTRVIATNGSGISLTSRDRGVDGNAMTLSTDSAGFEVTPFAGGVDGTPGGRGQLAYSDNGLTYECSDDFPYTWVGHATGNSSQGAQGEADAGKLAEFAADGALAASEKFTVRDNTPPAGTWDVRLRSSSGVQRVEFQQNAHELLVAAPTLTGDLTQTHQNRSGTIPAARSYATEAAALAANSSGNTKLLKNGEIYEDVASGVVRAVPGYPTVTTSSPASGGSVTLTDLVDSLYIVNSSGVLAALTVNFPGVSACRNGQTISIRFDCNVTALTWAAGLATILNAPVSAGANQTYTFVCYGVSGLGSPVWQCVSRTFPQSEAIESLWDMHRVVQLPYFTSVVSGTASSSAALQVLGIGVHCGTSNGSYARGIVGASTNFDPQTTGGNMRAGQRMRFCAVGEFVALAVANGGVLRMLVGATVAAPPLADANALSAAGFGVEWAYDGANSRMQVRLVSHNGTTYQTSAWAPFRAEHNRRCAIILDHVGDGTLNLYAAENGPTDRGCPRPNPVAVATLFGVPTGTLGGGYVAFDAVSASAASAPSFGSSLRFKLREVRLVLD